MLLSTIFNKTIGEYIMANPKGQFTKSLIDFGDSYGWGTTGAAAGGALGVGAGLVSNDTGVFGGAFMGAGIGWGAGRLGRFASKAGYDTATKAGKFRSKEQFEILDKLNDNTVGGFGFFNRWDHRANNGAGGVKSFWDSTP